MILSDILDDFARDLKYVHEPDAHKKYVEARDKTVTKLRAETLKEVGAYLKKQSTECPVTAYGRWNIIVELPGIISRLLRGGLEEPK